MKNLSRGDLEFAKKFFKGRNKMGDDKEGWDYLKAL